MNTIPVHRRGRRYFTSGPKYPRDRHIDPSNSKHDERKKGFCFWLGTFLLVLLPFYIFLHMEHRRFAVYTALSEISNGGIIELPLLNNEHHQPQLLKRGNIVHGSSQKIRSKVTDPSLGVTIDHALTLERNTEFCQWQEFQSASCQTCSRDIHIKDGSGRSHTEAEHYECDCVVRYDYYNTWRPYLINSLLFDQPAAHYNPQRNPLPSSYLVSNDALMEFTSTRIYADHHPRHHDHADSRPTSVMAIISPAMLAKRVNGASARTVKWVRDGIPPIPPFWKRWIPDRSRYEHVRDLDYTYGYDRILMSNPDKRFAYVGDGYFFSPHEPSKMEKMFKVFGEYLEGSLFDWQLGDIFPSCTPGDIRIRYMCKILTLSQYLDTWQHPTKFPRKK